MHWEGERYVRLYTRDTVNWKLLPWQSKCVVPLVMRKLDRSGILELGGAGMAGIAALIDLPLEVVTLGIDGAILGKVLVIANDALVMPNFLEAQEVQATDAQRQRDLRERRRAEGLVRKQINGTDKWATHENDNIQVTEGHKVTEGHESGHKVTEGHESGHKVTDQVTPAVPCRAEPAVPNQPPPQAAVEKLTTVPEPEEFEPDSTGEFRPTAWGYWGWHNRERHDAELFDEPTPPHKLRQWHDAAQAKVGIPGLIRAYQTYLADPAFADRAWPFSIFMSDKVWLPRANAPPRQAVRL